MLGSVRMSCRRLESLSDPTPTKANETVKNYFPEVFTTKRIRTRLYYKVVSVQFERAKLTFVPEKQRKKKFLLEGGSFILKRMKKKKRFRLIFHQKKKSF